MSAKGIRVSVEDLDTGDTEAVVVPPGEYLILATNPCWLAHTQTYANGTHVLTMKGRIRRATPPNHGEETK